MFDVQSPVSRESETASDGTSLWRGILFGCLLSVGLWTGIILGLRAALMSVLS